MPLKSSLATERDPDLVNSASCSLVLFWSKYKGREVFLNKIPLLSVIFNVYVSNDVLTIFLKLFVGVKYSIAIRSVTLSFI